MTHEETMIECAEMLNIMSRMAPNPNHALLKEATIARAIRAASARLTAIESELAALRSQAAAERNRRR